MAEIFQRTETHKAFPAAGGGVGGRGGEFIYGQVADGEGQDITVCPRALRLSDGERLGGRPQLDFIKLDIGMCNSNYWPCFFFSSPDT